MTTADRLNEINSGPGWFEVIHPTSATTHIVYVHENGSLYFPEGTQVLDRHEFAFADARGMAHRLVRSAALVAALRAVLEEIDKRGKQAREALPPSLAALAVPSYQFNVRASDVIRAIEEALS